MRGFGLHAAVAALALSQASRDGALDAIPAGDPIPRRTRPEETDEQKAARAERLAAYHRKIDEARARKLEHDRPRIEAAQAKRERRAAKRLGERQ